MTETTTAAVGVDAVDAGGRSGTGEPLLSVDHLVKAFGGESRRARWRKDGGADGESRVLAVNDINFSVGSGELFTLLGPSGCGKTTTLRSVAGLERPEQGHIAVGGESLFDARQGVEVPANRRGLGMVFQSYAIWPHMSVFDNVAFPFKVMPRSRKPGKRAIAERVERVLQVVGLDGTAGRSATKLSGGQQQRLALCRALVIEPALLLLDEPLSNLDAKLRENMRFELKRLQRELGLTAIYVTHDQSEALALSSRIAVMEAGEIKQVGKPRDIYDNPTCRFVAEFVGVSNFVAGRVTAIEQGWCDVSTAAGVLRVMTTVGVAMGEEVMLSVRPEYVSLRTDEPEGTVPNRLSGRVLTRAFLGDSVDHVVRVGDVEFRNRSNPVQSIRPESDVYLTLDPMKITVVPTAETQS